MYVVDKAIKADVCVFLLGTKAPISIGQPFLVY